MCHLFKLVLVIIGFSRSTQLARLRCYKGSLDNQQVVTLDNAESLIRSQCINRSLPTVIYTFGYRGKVNGAATKSVLTAYLQKVKRNVLLLDWEDEAQSAGMSISWGYVLYAVPNAKLVGEQLGDSLVSLGQQGVEMGHIHLIGHSLGAHIMGTAGRRARAKRHVVSRITGLDPARVLYEGSLKLQRGLDRVSARFVDVVHTDPGGYGVVNGIGTVDFWPNSQDSKQPGCPEGEFNMFSAEDLCSHDRAWQYFVESLSQPKSFFATSALGKKAGNRKEGIAQTNYMGEFTNTSLQGDFYFTTNSKAPYGRGESGANFQENEKKSRHMDIMNLFKYFR